MFLCLLSFSQPIVFPSLLPLFIPAFPGLRFFSSLPFSHLSPPYVFSSFLSFPFPSSSSPSFSLSLLILFLLCLPSFPSSLLPVLPPILPLSPPSWITSRTHTGSEATQGDRRCHQIPHGPLDPFAATPSDAPLSFRGSLPATYTFTFWHLYSLVRPVKAV